MNKSINENNVLPFDIDHHSKYTMQFWLWHDGVIITTKGIENPFPCNVIESAHPFTPLQQNQWIELDTTGDLGPCKAVFRVHSVLHRLVRQGASRYKRSLPEYGPEIAHWHTDVFVQKAPLPEYLTTFHTDVSHK